VTDAHRDADELERRVAALEAEVRALKQSHEHRPASAQSREWETWGATRKPHASSTPPPGAPSSWIPANVDFESLIGRYGTLVLATVSALTAVGLFLGWAIERGLLGPTQRIALGLLTAAALAVGGLRLRQRERSFGASLLGLSLAIVHVCAWGAGPSLHIVPLWVAFLLAAVTSVALAIFAHAEDDEPLWAVGFSGAAVAPFVTSSGQSNLLLLAAYGAAVHCTSGYALGARHWPIAGRLFLLAALAYTTVLAIGAEREAGPLLAMAFPLAVAMLGVTPWISGWRRRDRLRALGALAGVAALRTAIGAHLPYSHETVAMLVAGAGAIWLVLVDRTYSVTEPTTTPTRRLYEGDWLDAAVVPLAFICASIMALDASARDSGVAMAAAGAVLLVTVARFPQGSLRDAAVFTTVICALVASLLLLRGRALEVTVAIAGLSTACYAGNRPWRSVSWTAMGMIGLAWSALAAVNHLTTREPYAYTPFGTSETLVAVSVLAAAVLSWRLAAGDERLARHLGVGAIAWAFIWVHQEILFAFNRTASTLLLVSYYALTSVAAVAIGRARHLAALRHLGLGLAALAAGTALYGARNLTSIGARIGADLVAAVFLLAIAYWYRRPGSAGPSSMSSTVPRSQPSPWGR
jgi:hypothetical protein